MESATDTRFSNRARAGPCSTPWGRAGMPTHVVSCPLPFPYRRRAVARRRATSRSDVLCRRLDLHAVCDEGPGGLRPAVPYFHLLRMTVLSATNAPNSTISLITMAEILAAAPFDQTGEVDQRARQPVGLRDNEPVALPRSTAEGGPSSRPLPRCHFVAVIGYLTRSYHLATTEVTSSKRPISWRGLRSGRSVSERPSPRYRCLHFALGAYPVIFAVLEFASCCTAFSTAVRSSSIVPPRMSATAVPSSR
jgi:hypothetical protein